MSEQTILDATETFLADLGVEVALPTVGAFCRSLIRATRRWVEAFRR